MTTSSILKSAWTTLEGESERLPGTYERRVFAHSGFSVFAGLVRPAMQLRLTIDVPSSVSTDGLERETKGFRVQRQYSARRRVTRVSLELAQQSFRELFEVVAEDIAERVLPIHDESAAVAAMRERLNHWERFMSAAGQKGLSREDQIGLFGELTFLRTLLRAGAASGAAVGCWNGPRGENQDFQAGDRSVEVKTTTGNIATAVTIANELQLDDADCHSLFLMHLWLREQTGGGTSLPQLIDEIDGLLTGTAADEFHDRLVAAGYHSIHRHLYEENGYTERATYYYIVMGDFPRLCRADLRSGVGKVTYGIELAGFEGFQRPEPEVLRSLMDGLT